MKTCPYCDSDFDLNKNPTCPICQEIEPKRIQGYTRSKHPLYNRWIQIKDYANVEFDKTFSVFYLFTKWFSSKTNDFSDVVMRRNLDEGFTVQNCYVDTSNYSGTKQRMFLKLSEQDRESLKKLIDGGYSASQIAKLFGVARTTAQNLIEDYKRHEQMSKYL